jgi:tetratricopeptide (TPR) repeat protein
VVGTRLRLIGLACVLAGLPCPAASADEQRIEFINALDAAGYHDMIVEYVAAIRTRPDTPVELREQADFLIGKALLGGADSLSEPGQRNEQLQKARQSFERFLADFPNHDRAAAARLELAQILVERGRNLLIQAQPTGDESPREDLRQQARSLFDDAAKSFSDAKSGFAAAFKAFPAYIPESDRKQRDAKSLAQINLMEAHLHLGMTEYERAQSYDKINPTYRQTLESAVKTFGEVHTQYRFLLGGLFARVWQGKCYEEMGEFSKAEGCYQELVEHEDREAPAMQALQRQVQYFQIILYNKRGDHLLAVDAARRWLIEHRNQRRTEMGAGVLYEQAQGLIQDATAESTRATDRGRLLGEAMEVLAEIVRHNSIYKQPAIVLQQKYKGMAGAGGGIASFDRAVAMAVDARDRRKWADAADLYTQALSLATDKTDLDQLALVRYTLGFCHFQLKNYYESGVLGEYVTRRQATSSVAAPAGHLAMEAYAHAFDELRRQGQPVDFEQARVLGLAEHLMRSWPGSAESNKARFLLADLHRLDGRPDLAGELLEGVAAGSPDRALALVGSGEAYWQAYIAGASKPAEERDASKLSLWLKRARENLAKGVTELVAKLKPDAPLPLEVGRAQVNLAEVLLENSEAAESVKLMQELVPKVSADQNLAALLLPAFIVLLRGQIMTDNLPAAQITMQEIEGTGKDLAQITRVYLDLGRQLQAEVERVKARNDARAEQRIKESYVAFLNQLAGRREGQTFVTLQWTGEAFFSLEMYREAADRFREVVSRAASDSRFLDKSKPQNQTALLQVRLRLVTALRKQRQYSEAWNLIKPLPKESNTSKDPLHEGVIMNYDIIIERGLVSQDWGATDPTKLTIAVKHWAFWAQRMEPMKEKPPQYFEIRLNLVRSLLKVARAATDSKEREQSLRQVEGQLLFLTKTYPQLGGPKLKEQYQRAQQDLERELGRPIGKATAAAKS